MIKNLLSKLGFLFPAFSSRGKQKFRSPLLEKATNKEAKHLKIRLNLLLGVLFCFLLVLVGRLFQLSFFERNFLEAQGNARVQRTIPLAAYRGMITDRRGEPLAISVPVKSIWINPQQFDIHHPEIKKLLALLDLNFSQMQKNLNQNNQKNFEYLKRQIDPETADKVLALHIPGVYAEQEYRRFYPQSQVSAQVIGFTNVDEEGQEGLELAFERWLQGVPGKEQVTRDLYGHVVSVQKTLQQAKPGHTLVLSLDNRLQYLAYQALEEGVTAHEASSASMIILDAQTNEILAMANYPSFNPNIRPKKRDERYRNHALTDVFEPGSTIKAFAVANALATGKFTPHSLVDTSPGWMILNGKKVEDEHNNEIIDVTTILQRSSNVGVTKLSLETPPQSLWNLLKKIGFGQKTQSHFPGEVNGALPFHKNLTPFTLATLSFGYGMNVTALQLVQAYSIFANHGIKHPVTFLKVNQPLAQENILEPKIADEVFEMLKKVVDKGGTASTASIPGFNISGKTGTVRMLGANGYEKSHHIAIFVGAVPASRPRFIACVVVTDPHTGGYFGGQIAAPIFANVMGQALHEYDIAPEFSNGSQ